MADAPGAAAAVAAAAGNPVAAAGTVATTAAAATGLGLPALGSTEVKTEPTPLLPGPGALDATAGLPALGGNGLPAVGSIVDAVDVSALPGMGGAGPAMASAALAAVVAVQVQPAKLIETVEIGDDDFTPPTLFVPATEITLAQKTIEVAGSPHNVDLILNDEVFSLRAKSDNVNVANLSFRCFIDLGLEFAPVKGVDDAVKMELGPYTVTIYKAGAIEMIGRFEAEATKTEVLSTVRQCAARCGDNKLLADDAKMKTEKVTASALLKRKLILPKLVAKLKKDDSGFTVQNKTGGVEVKGAVGGHRVTIKISSLGKIHVQAPTRVTAKLAFEAIIAHIAASNSIQVMAGDTDRRASVDDSARKAAKLTAADSPSGPSGATSAAATPIPAALTPAQDSPMPQASVASGTSTDGAGAGLPSIDTSAVAMSEGGGSSSSDDDDEELEAA